MHCIDVGFRLSQAAGSAEVSYVCNGVTTFICISAAFRLEQKYAHRH